MVVGTPGRIAEHLDPGRISERLGVMNLARCDGDVVADLEDEAHPCACHEQSASQNPIGFGDFGVEVRLAAFDDRDGAFAGQLGHHFPLVGSNFDLGVGVFGLEL